MEDVEDQQAEEACGVGLADVLAVEVGERVGDALGRMFRSTGNTQAEVAKALGVSQSTVSAWVRGVTIPSIAQVFAAEEACSAMQGYVFADAELVPEVSVPQAIFNDGGLTGRARDALNRAYRAVVDLEHRRRMESIEGLTADDYIAAIASDGVAASPRPSLLERVAAERDRRTARRGPEPPIRETTEAAVSARLDESVARLDQGLRMMDERIRRFDMARLLEHGEVELVDDFVPGPRSNRMEIYTDTDGHWRGRIRTSDGRSLVTTAGYASREEAAEAILSATGATVRTVLPTE